MVSFWQSVMCEKLNPYQLPTHGTTMKKSTLPNSPEMNARKRDTRRKILIGSCYLKKAKQVNKFNELRTEMLAFLTREIDRDLFNDV